MSTIAATPPVQPPTLPSVVPPSPPVADSDPSSGGLASIYRLSVEQYHEMLEAGILKSGDPVELLEGYLVTKMPHGIKHDFAIRFLTQAYFRMLPEDYLLNPQTAATLADSEPEPDLLISRGPIELYLTRHPGPEDAAILIEVSDSSLRRDTREKARIYARARVPEYWIVNIPDKRIEVYTQPSGPTDSPKYASRVDYAAGAAVPVVLDGKPVGSISVDDVIR